ncbi:MAG: stage II sporulation protein P [Oscillospiraceae bacterium]|nr:stage II sporulation protein P [Oscillospiraceae bacterium]
MRVAGRKTKHIGIRRPICLLIFAVIFVRIMLADNALSILNTAALREISLNQSLAKAFLKFETTSWTLPRLSWSTLLKAETPFLSSGLGTGEVLQTEKPQETPYGNTELLDIPRGDIPVLVPEIPEPIQSPQPKSGAVPLSGNGQWDDRVWPIPNKGDAGARPLKEVTLLPQNQDGSYITDGRVYLNNATKYSVNISKLLKDKNLFKEVNAKKPQILIIHTHGSESFLPDERNYYVPTDIQRTENTRYNVVRLGDEMTRRFEAMDIKVIHDRHIHDYPSYSGSYVKSLQCVTKILQKNPGIQIVIDIHRDAITKKNGTMYKTVAQTKMGKVAQMMFVVGSDAKGLPHDSWQSNLAFAASLQQKILKENPTLMRPINIRNERFNQHARPGALILEVGTSGNSLDEAIASISIFCDITGPHIKKQLGI